MLKHVLDRRVADASMEGRRRYGDRAHHAPMSNRLSRYIVFSKLINQRTRHDVAEEVIHLGDETAGGGLFPTVSQKIVKISTFLMRGPFR